MKRLAAAILPLLLTVGVVLAQDDTTASATPQQLSGAAAAGIFGTMCLFWLVGLAIYLWGAIWVMKDAKRRNSPNATLVTVLTWLPPTWLIGIIVHLVTRPKTTTTT
ncbi:MAG: hypothetical protein ACJ8IQ_04155 [Chthoniobacterales bacterium]|jgi:hypothetical protein